MSKYVIDSSTLVGIADAIREKKGTSAPIQVSNFAQQIGSIVGGSGVDVKTILENAKSLDSLNKYGLLDDYYTQNSITLNLAPKNQSFTSAFQQSTLCDEMNINIDGTDTGGGSSPLSYFLSQSKVKKVNLHIENIRSDFRLTNFNYLFYSCQNLEEVNNDIFDFVPSMQAITQKSNQLFGSCYNLKKLPSSIGNLQINQATTSMYWGLQGLYSLRRLDIPICLSKSPTGFMVYSGDFNNLYSVKHIVFTNPNNVVYTGAVSSNNNYLTLNLSNYVGYFNGTSYSSLITDIADGTRPRVTNDAEYEQYKNDDYWTTSVLYSHYNKPAAIETLQSLPDLSGWGFTFVVKFQGSSGQNTDGGAINTMTDDEIAIATNKNWTVQFV